MPKSFLTELITLKHFCISYDKFSNHLLHDMMNNFFVGMLQSFIDAKLTQHFEL